MPKVVSGDPRRGKSGWIFVNVAEDEHLDSNWSTIISSESEQINSSSLLELSAFDEKFRLNNTPLKSRIR